MIKVPRPGWLEWALVYLLLGYLLAWCVYAEETHARRTQARKEQLDVPVMAPKLGQPMRGFYPQEENNPPPEPPPEGDDPRDTPPPVFYGEEIDTESDSLIYVLDRSGSMSLGKPSRWERARTETIRSVSGLAENMRFDVVLFGVTVCAQWGQLRDATPQAKKRTSSWLGSYKPAGGTPTAAGCAMALAEDRSNLCLILLTDGAPSTGTASTRVEIQRANSQGAAINCFGVDARGEFRAFLQGVAADSGGQYADVP